MASNTIVPMAVSGVRHLVERAYRESGELQYVRELVVNALEAGATKIEIGPEWAGVERDHVYRLMIADNGRGMDPEELLKFLNTFGGGGKPIGEAHENFGVGAKTSLLPWNHHGVVVLSWTKSNPSGAMVWLMRDPLSGEYGAKKFETTGGAFEEVILPPQDWAAARPNWLDQQGTVVVCMGNTGHEDTFLGKTGDGDIKGLSAYLNKRLWAMAPGVELHVQELRTEKRAEWPKSLAEASGPAGKPDRRWNRRQIRGAGHFVESVESEKGKFLAKGTEKLSDGTEIDWYLWDGERPAVHSYAHKNGYIAALYRNELYDTQQHPAHFRSFGITQGAVRANLTLIARPPHSDGSYGVYPDTARSALKIQGTKRAGEPLPWATWGQEFAENLPSAIREALAKAAPSSSGTIQDATWRSRLLDRFGARWRSLRFVATPNGSEKVTATEAAGSSGGTSDNGGLGGGGGTGRGPGPSGPQASALPTVATTSSPNGIVGARKVQVPGGLPDWEWTTMSNIDETSAVAAAWCPPSTDKPNGSIQLARDFPAILEVKSYWRSQYPDHQGDQIDSIIEDVYGEAMVARIAHSESLATHPTWGRARVDTELRSPVALTMSILGLLSEDYLISARVTGTLGKRKKD
ncbi:MAG: ATP-binding protein [Myxococcota bacterium]